MIIESTFKPAWWLTNSHAQTMYPTLLRRLNAPVTKLEQLELPDGDFLNLAWAEGELESTAPLVILLHGLGGSLSSSYIPGLMQACNQHGWRSVLMHFRGSGDKPNRLLRAYHSGDTEDLNYFLQELAHREPATKKAIIGVSLGGNVLLKWLGETGGQSFIETAVAVSVPFDLRLVADRIHQGFSRVYEQYLLKKLQKLFVRKLENHKGDVPPALKEMDKWTCFWTFDEYVTAPLHGFKHVHAYYRTASSRRYLSAIQTPTLIIHALDDPFMTPKILPATSELSPQIQLELSPKGGHVGFVTGHIPGHPVYWLDVRIPTHLAHYL